ncbi:hypothetical protein WA026_017993 [Henosepilachna vigintioctopunctata]|uniref:Uncharacterized protein n=1 Tax=Henosepilachna vigintioctopunctata TaxID=420089 RepID=A0AAW1TQB5_9CUCU
MSKEVKSKERRQLFDNLRRKGNFLAGDGKCFKAVGQTYVPDRTLLPCDNCMGYFSSKLLRTHREKLFVNVTSRKMRELSKILVEMRKLDKSINTLFSALQPKYFDLFVEATKLVAKYDPEKDVYNSPTFAMNIGTSLKQCCELAISMAYKKTSSISFSC